MRGSYKTKTSEETYELFEKIAMKTQHIDTRGKRVVSNSNYASSVQISKLGQKLDALLVMNSRNPPNEMCTICETHDHATIASPLGVAYLEFAQEQANLVIFYNQGPRNDPYSQSYNQSWRNYPNFS
ncbi:hypothetical protein L3X38_027212 [Prunus dulcis]|uniref:Uncharacterized protein n=1 Tax=Prunus dulcis TaxID=3755 RepID=A0AAD4Z027_PRUDU|nr:hypothetical protein L3X38_027212 [Prunus dulcis]